MMESSVFLRWPGHVPGRFYFGMSHTRHPFPPRADASRQPPATENPTAGIVESYGVHRSSIPWARWKQVNAQVASDHAARRLPWISIRPPVRGVNGWRDIALGRHDQAIYQLGRRLVAAMTLPTIVTFDDDPTDAADEDGRVWARAYCRFHDNLAAATGLRLMAEAPIISDWLFNPTNLRQDPANWLTTEVLDRSSLLGLNVFESASGETFERRLPRILDWLDSRGFEHLMVGVAMSGATDYAPAYVAPAAWLNQSLEWTAKNTDRVTIVCYSSVGEWQGLFWTESELGQAATGTQKWAQRAITKT